MKISLFRIINFDFVDFISLWKIREDDISYE